MKLSRSEWFVLGGLMLLSLIPCVGGLLRLIELGLGTTFEFLPENPRAEASPLPLQIHLVTSIPYCILGIFQFLPSLRRRHLGLHRSVGRVLAAAGVASALSALWMTQYYAYPASHQSDFLYVVRLIVGISMLACIVLGVTTVLKKRVRQHEAWMIRAYALAQGAGTQAVIGVPWTLLAGEPAGIARDTVMAVGWAANLMVAELFVRRRG